MPYVYNSQLSVFRSMSKWSMWQIGTCLQLGNNAYCIELNEKDRYKNTGSMYNFSAQRNYINLAVKCILKFILVQSPKLLKTDSNQSSPYCRFSNILLKTFPSSSRCMYLFGTFWYPRRKSGLISIIHFQEVAFTRLSFTSTNSEYWWILDQLFKNY